MKLFVPGKVAKLDKMKGGECIAFMPDDKMSLGVVVQDGNNIDIIRLEPSEPDLNSPFIIYKPQNLINKEIFLIENTQISPIMLPERMAWGHFNGAMMSQALYVTGDGPIVYAKNHHDVYKINLGTGRYSDLELSSQVCFRDWEISCPTANGDIALIRKFSS